MRMVGREMAGNCIRVETPVGLGNNSDRLLHIITTFHLFCYQYNTNYPGRKQEKNRPVRNSRTGL